MADERKPQVKEEKPVLRVGLFTAWMASTGLLLVLVVLVAAWSLQQIEGRARSRAREDAIHRIETIRNRVQEEAAARPGATIEELVRSTRWVTAVLNRQASTGEHIEWIAIVSPAGVVLARSGAGEFARDSSLRPSDSLPSPGESTPPAGVALTKDEVIRYAVPVTLAGRELGTVQIGLSSRGLDAAVTELLRPVWRAFIVLGCVCLAVLLLGGMVMRHLLNRERMLDRAAARQEQLAAMGGLARRMVHEIRNPLNAMRMQIAVIQDLLSGPQAPSDTVRVEHLERLDQEVTRLEKLAKSFLVYGRPPRDEPEQIELRDALDDVAEFIRPAFERIGAHVEVQIEQGIEPLVVRMDKSKLREVLLNLTENAREAMDGGTLTIRLGRVSRDEALIQIVDTGRGIPEGDLPMIFQGLRSTKTDGSGLGLLIVKRIVEDTGGSITVDSQIGRGTRFDIVLPTIPRKG